MLEDGWLYDLTSADPVGFRSLDSAYAKAGADVSSMVSLLEEGMRRAERRRYDEKLLKIPLEGPEIWAAGVTYLRSREARETETKSKGIYDRVYEAVRPELFVKDTGLRCRGPGEEIRVRSDSHWSVPEPELTVVFDEETRIVGYTAGNDVSSRDIEGENPLYLPQAKVYRGSSAIGPVITTVDEIPDPQKLEIKMKILRDGKVAFEGAVNTSQMKRSVAELSEYLARDNILKRFTLLMTGTSIVPPDDFTLQGGDTVEIEIEGIGLLRNPVVQLR
ncbi:MAG: fumarylacetoacetate hydrolase family protein [Thaumarchaeota archaeon]|nr:fumarylacetoacetate hydrolase family protein [Nitrososphaerota archaeon]